MDTKYIMTVGLFTPKEIEIDSSDIGTQMTRIFMIKYDLLSERSYFIIKIRVICVPITISYSIFYLGINKPTVIKYIQKGILSRGFYGCNFAPMNLADKRAMRNSMNGADRNFGIVPCKPAVPFGSPAGLIGAKTIMASYKIATIPYSIAQNGTLFTLALTENALTYLRDALIYLRDGAISVPEAPSGVPVRAICVPIRAIGTEIALIYLRDALIYLRDALIYLRDRAISVPVAPSGVPVRATGTEIALTLANDTLSPLGFSTQNDNLN